MPPNETVPRRLRFNPFELDLESGELWRGTERVLLPDQPFRLLAILIRERGNLVSRETLRHLLWSDDTFVDFEAGLNAAVKRLRETLGDSATAPAFIETLPRRGYRFIATVEPVNEAPSGEAEPLQPLDPSPARPGWPRLALGVTALAVIAIAVVAALASRPPSATPASDENRGAVSSIRSIAVLPLRDVSPDPKEAWFAEGMTDSIISDLGRVSALQVMSGQSTKTFQMSRESMHAISRRLGADAVIEGSTALANGRVRVSVRLVHGSTDRQVWSGTYERPLADILTLQGELAQTIAESVRAVVTADEQKALARRGTVHPDAYIAYLRAGHFFNLRGRDNVKRSLEYYETAIAHDPTFAAAYGGLALSHCLLVGTRPPADAYRPVKAAAERALKYDPTQADALLALSQAAFLGDRDWRTARRILQDVLGRNPNHATAHLWYASLLTEIGPLEEAVVERRRALELDPLSFANNKLLGDVLLQAGRNAEALTAFESALELEPASAEGLSSRGLAHIWMGQPDKGITDLESAARLVPSDVSMSARLAHGYGLAGRRSDAQRLLRSLTERSRSEYVSPISLAQVHAGLRERDAAFALLDAAFTQGTPGLMRLKSNIWLDPLKDDQRFAALVKRLDLPWP
jgi:TolB-like protein/DNA-binding winged helix-turn-helix (wHTH) protein/Tfp pilus assembly protein PilF